MTWICSFGVVNCPVCKRATEKIKSMAPNIPDVIIKKSILDQKIDLHQKIENVSISIMAGGEPKIEVNTDKDEKLKIGIDNPDNPFFSRQLITKTETNTEPWEMDNDYIWNISKDAAATPWKSIIGLDDIETLPFTMSIKEGDLPPMFISPSRISLEPDSDTFSWSTSFEADGPLLPSDYQIIGRPVAKPEVQKVDKLIPTSKLYKEMKENDVDEIYRRKGIRAYTAPDGKKTLIVDKKSEIQF